MKWSIVKLSNDCFAPTFRARAEVEISFWTVTDDASDSLMSVYRPSSLTYTPANEMNSLEYVKNAPTGGRQLN